MSEIRIYVEGGGDRGDTRAAIRTGFNKFLEPLRGLAQEQRIRWNVTACGSRQSAYRDFQTALRSHPDAFIVLLVDSEAPVVGGRWEHLRNREDGWDDHGGLSDDHCHLMVQTVEAWLVADPDALARFYGQNFQKGSLPRRDDVEEIPKADLESSLGRATERTQKGRYHKIRHCSDLLGLLDPRRVRSRARHCELLFATLEARMASMEKAGR
ncbi:MAG: DUF4276 family protein [Thermoanaerobaculia bacterium]